MELELSEVKNKHREITQKPKMIAYIEVAYINSVASGSQQMDELGVHTENNP